MFRLAVAMQPIILMKWLQEANFIWLIIVELEIAITIEI